MHRKLIIVASSMFFMLIAVNATETEKAVTKSTSTESYYCNPFPECTEHPDPTEEGSSTVDLFKDMSSQKDDLAKSINKIQQDFTSNE